MAFNILITSPPFFTLPLTNVVFVDPHVTLSFDHASVIPTDEISRFQRSYRFSTSNTIRCVLHVSCPRDSERPAPPADLFICERTRTMSLRERHRSSWCITEFGQTSVTMWSNRIWRNQIHHNRRNCVWHNHVAFHVWRNRHNYLLMMYVILLIYRSIIKM